MKETTGRNRFKDAMDANANAQHALAAMFCDAGNAGFDGDGDGGRNMREGFAHIMRLLQKECEEAVAAYLTL